MRIGNLSKHRQQRRARKIRYLITRKDKNRLCISRSNKNIYAQLISADGSKTLASASTLDKNFKDAKSADVAGKIGDAKIVGKLLADKIKALGLPAGSIAVDRSGYKYHGRVKALVEAVRENGLQL